MIYIATGLRNGIREFRAAFRTRQEADTFVHEKAVGGPMIIPEEITVGAEKKKVFVAQRYFQREDLHGYHSVYEDSDAAHQAAGQDGSVLSCDV